MTPKAPITPKQVRLIQIARRQLGLEEDTYRQLLRAFGADSCKDLVQWQVEELLAHFRRCGFRPKCRRRVAGAPDFSRLPPEKQGFLAAVETSLEALGLPWAYAEGIARRMKFPAKLEWCSPEQIHTVVKALGYKRQKEAAGSVSGK